MPDFWFSVLKCFHIEICVKWLYFLDINFSYCLNLYYFSDTFLKDLPWGVFWISCFVVFVKCPISPCFWGFKLRLGTQFWKFPLKKAFKILLSPKLEILMSVEATTVKLCVLYEKNTFRNNDLYIYNFLFKPMAKTLDLCNNKDLSRNIFILLFMQRVKQAKTWQFSLACSVFP